LATIGLVLESAKANILFRRIDKFPHEHTDSKLETPLEWSVPPKVCAYPVTCNM